MIEEQTSRKTNKTKVRDVREVVAMLKFAGHNARQKDHRWTKICILNWRPWENTHWN